jgi:outer membrane protein OmpA-like peptidoglycan-associated protein
MKDNHSHFFWPSYTDLMTSLFFVMLVLYVLTYVKLRSTITLQKEKLTIIDAVENNLQPLKKDTVLFRYEPQYKRFKLSFDVKFPTNEYNITNVENYTSTIAKIDQAGRKLKQVIDNLKQAKNANPRLENVSYILVIAGYASKFGSENHNYVLSYNRALSLWNYWRSKGIDFEGGEYADLIDLQISGNGWGGIGRVLDNEHNNQRFLIQIFPKIGDMNQ